MLRLSVELCFPLVSNSHCKTSLLHSKGWLVDCYFHSISSSSSISSTIDGLIDWMDRPIPLTLGYLAQYMIKPMLGMVIARVFRIPPMFYAGFILTCCVAGAQLSSYASFLSKGDVALSILLTSTTTITSAIVTPLLTGLLIGSVVPVDAIAMSKSILQVRKQQVRWIIHYPKIKLWFSSCNVMQVVLFPVGIGLGLNTYAKPVVDVIKPVMPILALICTSLCIGSPLAINRSQILTRQGFNLLLPILSFHLLAFFFGYWFSKIPFCR